MYACLFTACGTFWPSNKNRFESVTVDSQPCYEGSHWQLFRGKPLGRGVLKFLSTLCWIDCDITLYDMALVRFIPCCIDCNQGPLLTTRYLSIPTQWHLLTGLGKKPFENNQGKRRNCLYKQFLLFPLCFLLFQRQKLSFLLHLICHLLMLSICSGPKFCCVGMG